MTFTNRSIALLCTATMIVSLFGLALVGVGTVVAQDQGCSDDGNFISNERKSDNAHPHGWDGGDGGAFLIDCGDQSKQEDPNSWEEKCAMGGKNSVEGKDKTGVFAGHGNCP